MMCPPRPLRAASLYYPSPPSSFTAPRSPIAHLGLYALVTPLLPVPPQPHLGLYALVAPPPPCPPSASPGSVCAGCPLLPVPPQPHLGLNVLVTIPHNDLKHLHIKGAGASATRQGGGEAQGGGKAELTPSNKPAATSIPLPGELRPRVSSLMPGRSWPGSQGRQHIIKHPIPCL